MLSQTRGLKGKESLLFFGSFEMSATLAPAILQSLRESFKLLHRRSVLPERQGQSSEVWVGVGGVELPVLIGLACTSLDKAGKLLMMFEVLCSRQRGEVSSHSIA